MKNLPYGVFLLAALLFACGVWIYETKDWSDFPIFFSLGSALLLLITVFLFWVWVTKGQGSFLFTASVSLIFLFLSAIPLIQKTAWIGTAKKEISVRVLDETTGKAIPEASVTLVSKFGTIGQAKTDRDGKTKIESSFRATGNFSLFQRQGGVHFLGLRIQVESDSYQTGFFDLEEKIGWWPLYGKPIPEIEIRLHKK
jgi:hypothetical protein